VGARAAEKPCHHLRVNDRAAGRQSAHRVSEVVDPCHPILEQVTDARRIVAQQLDRVACLDVLREHQDCDPGMLASNLARRLQPFGGMGGWHADVHHQHVRRCVSRQLDQAVDVGRLADDLEARGSQGRRKRFPQEDGVVGKADAQPRLTVGRHA
jgi:hypothetical protein